VQPGPWQTWRGSLADMRVAVAQARFLQFQGEISRLLAGGSAGSVQATTFFRYLPPVGYLPIRPPAFLVSDLVQDLLTEAVGNNGPLNEVIGLIAGNLNQLTSQVQGGLLQSGFDLQTFFGEAMPASVQLVDGESVDYYLQRSWYDEAIDLQGETRFSVYLVADVWQRLVGQRLVSLLAAQLGLAGMAANYRNILLDRLQQVLPPGVPGGEDRPYAFFVKQVAPKRSAPVTRAVTTGPSVLTGHFEVWHGYNIESAEAVALKKLAAGLEKANPGLTIELSAQGTDFIQLLMVAVPAGEGPDLVLTDNTQIPALAEAATIQPLDAVAKRDNAVADVAYASMTLSKQLYGIPQSFESAALFYNRAVVPQPPADHKALLVRTRLLQGRVALPEEVYFHYGFFPAFGGKVMDKAGRSIADRGGVAEAMQLLRNLQQVGAEFLPYEEARQRFLGQDSALMIDTPRSLDAYREALGDGLGVAPLPAGPEDAAQPLLRVEGYLAPAFCRSLAGSVALAELLTSAKAQALLAKTANKVPVRGDVDLNDEALLQFVALAGEAQPWPTQRQFPAFWEPFQQMMAEVLQAGRDPGGAVEDATRKMNQANGFG